MTLREGEKAAIRQSNGLEYAYYFSEVKDVVIDFHWVTHLRRVQNPCLNVENTSKARLIFYVADYGCMC